MEIKFKNTRLKIALKDEDNNLIGDLYLNPDNAIQRSKMIELYHKVMNEESKLKEVEEKIKNESDDLVKGTEVVQLEKEIFEMLLNGLVDIYGEVINKLADATGNDLGSFITLINGITPYYQEASNNSVNKYIGK